MNPANRDCAFKLLFALALLLAPAAAQARPQVAVDFDIEATKYKRNLYKQLGAVESTLEAALAQIGNEKFGFLDWKSGHSTPDRSAVSATLQVHMVDGDPGELGPSIWLKLSARPEAGKVFDCPSERPGALRFKHIGAVRLFSGSVPQSGNRGDLEARVKELLSHHFANGGFGQIFADAFLNQIPIGDKVELPFPSFPKYIAISIDPNELRLDSRGRMALRPCSRFPGEPQISGEIDLALTDATVGSAPRAQTMVISCRVPPREGDICIEAIPRILQHRLALDVFMRQYVRTFLGTNGERATAP